MHSGSQGAGEVERWTQEGDVRLESTETRRSPSESLRRRDAVDVPCFTTTTHALTRHDSCLPLSSFALRLPHSLSMIAKRASLACLPRFPSPSLSFLRSPVDSGCRFPLACQPPLPRLPACMCVSVSASLSLPLSPHFLPAHQRPARILFPSFGVVLSSPSPSFLSLSPLLVDCRRSFRCISRSRFLVSRTRAQEAKRGSPEDIK